MPKKSATKKSAKTGLTDTTLVWLSLFFMLVGVFAVLMYYRQAAETKALLQWKYQQQNTARLVSPAPTTPAKARK
ncbi:MAG TPA: hypothetical protein VFG51_02070 [Candidatus Saccharimonadia bacterium]|nr:hypothetical protein [Candidatus Saccharimonadia bacterium]